MVNQDDFLLTIYEEIEAKLLWVRNEGSNDCSTLVKYSERWGGGGGGGRDGG